MFMSGNLWVFVYFFLFYFCFFLSFFTLTLFDSISLDSIITECDCLSFNLKRQQNIVPDECNEWTMRERERERERKRERERMFSFTNFWRKFVLFPHPLPSSSLLNSLFSIVKLFSFFPHWLRPLFLCILSSFIHLYVFFLYYSTYKKCDFKWQWYFLQGKDGLKWSEE